MAALESRLRRTGEVTNREPRDELEQAMSVNVFRTLGLLAFLGSGACVSFRKPVPVLTPPSAVETSEVYRFSDKARQVRLTTIVADLPFGYEFGEQTWGQGGLAPPGCP